MYADYQPEGIDPSVDTIPLHIAGNSPDPVATSSEKLTAVTDGGLDIKVDLAAPLHTGAASLLPFRIEREGEQLRATALSPYLGAAAHLILIHQTCKDFLHVHTEAGTGAPVVAHTQFEKAGIYRMWIQFDASGIVHTADFTLDVKEATPAHTPMQHPAHHHG